MEFNEFEIYQNQVLGAHVLWEFSKTFYQYKIKKDKLENSAVPTLLHALPVLPLCLNSRVVHGIYSRNFREGGIIRALDDNKDLFSGLQERMITMTTLTFNSIYLAHASKLIHFDREELLLLPNMYTLPNKIDKKLYKDYKDIIASSRRVGFWLSQLSMPEILMYFNLSF